MVLSSVEKGQGHDGKNISFVANASVMFGFGHVVHPLNGRPYSF